MATMRAKVRVETILQTSYGEELKLTAVYSGDKNHEDNTFSSATPSATFVMTITNKELWGKFKPEQKFYVDFTEAE